LEPETSFLSTRSSYIATYTPISILETTIIYLIPSLRCCQQDDIEKGADHYDQERIKAVSYSLFFTPVKTLPHNQSPVMAPTISSSTVKYSPLLLSNE
jgi:hypothetical protein